MRYVVFIVLCVAAGLLPAASALAVPHDTDHTGAGIKHMMNAEPVAGAPEPERLVLSNGLRVTLYTAPSLVARMTERDGEPVIQIDAHRYLPVIDDINDPRIYNRGDGSFHPFARDMVVDALETIDHPYMVMEATVYILPFPRQALLVSSTSGSEIFLSPHVLDIHPAVGSYIVAHEFGHVFHNAMMPEGSHLWNEFRRVRGIMDRSRFHDDASHAFRPREIFAEDFRVLYGGAMAAYGGNIENPELASPLGVPGLAAFFESLTGTTVASTQDMVYARSFPNPFNPETEIRVSVPGAAQAGRSLSVRIYDVRGALVRELYDGPAGSDEMTLRWDGRDRRGNRVASAHYFAQVASGNARETLRLVLLK